MIFDECAVSDCAFIPEIKTLQDTHDSIQLDREDDVDSYYKIKKHLASMAEEYHAYIVQPEYCVPFFQPGRLVKVLFFISFRS